MKPRVSATSIVDAVAEDLRKRLYAAEFPGGTAFTENDVAQSYEVARPTAKAAIEKVVAEGLLVRGVHKTARVPELGPEDVRDIYRSRAYLETEVLRRLAARGEVPQAAVQANREIAEALDSENALAIVEPDMRFHTSLIDALGSVRTSKLYNTLVSEVRICMTQVQGRGLLDPKIICAEHDQILEYIRLGDGDAVACLLDEHLARARERLVAAVGGEAGPEASAPLSVNIRSS